MPFARLIFFTGIFLFSLNSHLSALTLEAIMSAPFPYELVASESTDRIAWVFNHAGRRNIWVADGPDYLPRQLTKYEKDDGQALHNLIFSKDGSFLAYVRGDYANNQNENPNPTSDPKGAKEEVWVVKIDGGEPKRIGEGSPTIDIAGW